MKFSSFYEFKKEQLWKLYEERQYAVMARSGSQGGEGGLYPWVSTKQAGFLGLILANTQFQNLSLRT